MKPFKLSISIKPDTTSLLYTWFCTKEILTDEIVHWKPSDGITKYLPSEMLAKFKPEAIEFTERFLINPNERPYRQKKWNTHRCWLLQCFNRCNRFCRQWWCDCSGSRYPKQQGTVVINKTVYIEGYGATRWNFQVLDSLQDLKIAPGIHIKTKWLYKYNQRFKIY